MLTKFRFLWYSVSLYAVIVCLLGLQDSMDSYVYFWVYIIVVLAVEFLFYLFSKVRKFIADYVKVFCSIRKQSAEDPDSGKD